MKFTVLIITYLRPEFLRCALESLRNQVRQADEVLVVHRPTDQETIAVLEEELQQGKLPLVTTKVTVPGIVAAENQGLRVAKGDVVALLDDDAVAPKDWLQRMESHFEDSRVGAVGGPAVPVRQGRAYYHYTTENCLRKTWYGAHTGNSERIPNRVQKAHSLRGCNLAFRRSAVLEFDPELLPYWRRFEDDAMFQVRQKGLIIIYDPQVRVLHHTAPVRQGQSRDQNPEAVYGSHHNNTYVMLKYLSLPRQLVFLVFTFWVGDRINPGFALFLGKGLLRGRLGEELKLCFHATRGKVAGMKRYLELRSNG